MVYVAEAVKHVSANVSETVGFMTNDCESQVGESLKRVFAEF